MRGLANLLCALNIVAMIATVGFSQPVRGEKYAFLVVCSKYNSTQLRDLPYTNEEMEDFRKALLKSGFAANQIVMLHDKGERERVPEKAKIEKQFRLLLNGLQPSDTVIVAINGHGVHFKGDKVGYLCPLDADLKDKKSLVSMEFFYDLLKRSKAKQKLMIVQACQNDPFVSNDFAAEKLEFTEKSDEVPEGIAAIFSCMEGQKSYYDPDRKRGLFFDHVIRTWNGEYLAERETKLDIEEFFRQVRMRTKADALQFRGGVEQVPEVRREYKGEWILAAEMWRQLFNGKDLSGWKNRDAADWKVEGGSLVGRGRRSLLFSERADLADFDLEVEFLLGENNNSGVFLRVPANLDTVGDGKGYEIEINCPKRAGGKPTGSVRYYPFEGPGRVAFETKSAPHAAAEWVNMLISARDNRFLVHINGHKTTEYIDADRSFGRGRIALQHLVDGSAVRFRRVAIKIR